MSAKLLEGKPVAEVVLDDVRKRVAQLRMLGVRPGLATVLVGEDPASLGYVRKKHAACADCGFYSDNVQLPATATQDDLHRVVQRLNADESVHGVLIQHPLPSHLDLSRALQQLSASKDADGLHPANMGALAIGLLAPVACTPAGIHAMLLHFGIATAGRHVVILGRGPTLGRPLSLLMSDKREGANAAVTVVHSAVPDLGAYTRAADILVSGVGQPGIVTPAMVREGAVVVSAGLSWSGKRLLPDVDEAVAHKASWITPRLGGVGVTTVAMLLRNTVQLAESTLAKGRSTTT